MRISKIDSVLLKHPYFKFMEASQRLAIYNKIYSEIFRIRDEITLINRIAYTSDRNYQIEVYHSDEINLSAQMNVDMLLNEHSLLKNLSNEQKLVVYTIAAHKLNVYRTLTGNQEYFFSTLRPDIIIRTPIYLKPILSLKTKVLNAVTFLARLTPQLKTTIKFFPTKTDTTYLVPTLSLQKIIIGARTLYDRLIPALSIKAEVMVVQLNDVLDYLVPSLNVSFEINSKTNLSTTTYEPRLYVTTQILIESDYIEQNTLEPILSVTTQITK